MRAKLVKQAWEYPWSSANAHIRKESNSIVDDSFMTNEITNWAEYISGEESEKDLLLFRSHSNTGRPLGEKEFIDLLEKKTGRILHRQKPGPKNSKRK